MTPKEMLDHFGGELVRGNARIRQDGKIVTIATYVGGQLTLTTEGTKISEGMKASTPKPKPKPKAKKAEPVTVEEPVEVSVDDSATLDDLFKAVEDS